MKHALEPLFLLLILAGGCTGGGDPGTFIPPGGDALAEPGRTYRWSFDADAAGSMPADFLVSLGDWSVDSEGDAPSAPNVLRQHGLFSSPSFPRAMVEGLLFEDLTVSVRCRAESGDIDQACGLMFRVQDSLNYYITRANALERNVRLYHVVDGNRTQLASADVDVTASEWHTLEASASGSDFIVRWDGAEVLSTSDTTFTDAGRIGLWLKADSTTAFDDLTATAN